MGSTEKIEDFEPRNYTAVSLSCTLFIPFVSVMVIRKVDPNLIESANVENGKYRKWKMARTLIVGEDKRIWGEGESEDEF